jgi:hypothetical protein
MSEKMGENYAEDTLDYAKFLRSAAMKTMEAASHGIRVPCVRIVLYTLEGQFIAVGVLENATICGDTIPHSVIREIGSEAAGYIAGAIALGAFGLTPIGWVMFAVASAAVSFSYGKFVDMARDWSKQNSRQPVYSVPYLDDIGYVKDYNIDEMWGLSGGRRIVNQYKEPKRPRAINECRYDDCGYDAYRARLDALPNEFFVGRPATPYDFVDITGGIGKKWLVRLDNQKFR